MALPRAGVLAVQLGGRGTGHGVGKRSSHELRFVLDAQADANFKSSLLRPVPQWPSGRNSPHVRVAQHGRYNPDPAAKLIRDGACFSLHALARTSPLAASHLQRCNEPRFANGGEHSNLLFFDFLGPSWGSQGTSTVAAHYAHMGMESDEGAVRRMIAALSIN